jgi:hypothetical protein
MAELHRENGFMFYIWSDDHPHPAHVHVDKGDGASDLDITAGKVVWQKGFKKQEIRHIERIFKENSEKILAGWREHFGAENL